MQCFSGADLTRCESRLRRVRCRIRLGAKGPAPKRRVSCILSLNGCGTGASTQIPSSEGWLPEAAGLGSCPLSTHPGT